MYRRQLFILPKEKKNDDNNDDKTINWKQMNNVFYSNWNELIFEAIVYLALFLGEVSVFRSIYHIFISTRCLHEINKRFYLAPYQWNVFILVGSSGVSAHSPSRHFCWAYRYFYHRSCKIRNTTPPTNGKYLLIHIVIYIAEFVSTKNCFHSIIIVQCATVYELLKQISSEMKSVVLSRSNNRIGSYRRRPPNPLNMCRPSFSN